jgi:hypothetical protein
MRMKRSAFVVGCCAAVYCFSCGCDAVRGPSGFVRDRQLQLIVVGLESAGRYQACATLVGLRAGSDKDTGMDCLSLPPVFCTPGTNSTSAGTVTVQCIVPEELVAGLERVPMRISVTGAAYGTRIAAHASVSLPVSSSTNALRLVRVALEQFPESGALVWPLNTAPVSIPVFFKVPH